MISLIDKIQEIKDKANPDNLGMILVHNGVVRATSDSGQRVNKISIDYSESELKKLIEEVERLQPVEKVWVWINTGTLSVGEDVMYVIMGGNKRNELFPIFFDFVDKIKAIVRKKEIF